MNLVSSYFQISIQPTLHRRWNWLVLPLLLMLISCGGGIGGGTPVPVEMRGQWQLITTSIPTYNPYPEGPPVFSGGDSVLGIFFYFWPDGRYQFNWNLMQSYYYSCYRTVRRSELGTLSIEGSDFTFRPNKATFSVLDPCDKKAFENPAQTQVVTLTITPTQDQAGWPYLQVRLPSGEEMFLEKCRDCK